jgi:hypothetical protein
MSNELIFVLVFFWSVSAAYVMYTHNKHYTLGLDTIIFSIILGPILALFIGDEEKKLPVEKSIRDYMNSDRHIRARGFTIPPPPPISQSPNRRPNKKKEFKFFRGC